MMHDQFGVPFIINQQHVIVCLQNQPITYVENVWLKIVANILFNKELIIPKLALSSKLSCFLSTESLFSKYNYAIRKILTGEEKDD